MFDGGFAVYDPVPGDKVIDPWFKAVCGGRVAIGQCQVLSAMGLLQPGHEFTAEHLGQGSHRKQKS